jgi:hypothetical protein
MLGADRFRPISNHAAISYAPRPWRRENAGVFRLATPSSLRPGRCCRVRKGENRAYIWLRAFGGFRRRLHRRSAGNAQRPAAPCCEGCPKDRLSRAVRHALLAKAEREELQVEATVLGVRLLVMNASHPSEFERAFETLVREQAGVTRGRQRYLISQRRADTGIASGAMDW